MTFLDDHDLVEIWRNLDPEDRIRIIRRRHELAIQVFVCKMQDGMERLRERGEREIKERSPT